MIKPGSLSEIQCMQNVHCSSRRERVVITCLVSVNTQLKNEDAEIDDQSGVKYVCSFI